ncbi:MAG: hypothetical protein CMP24_01355 [Rickettsiales bacterium]|nr:hypothetical protein [Rickettsiales bacterium]
MKKEKNKKLAVIILASGKGKRFKVKTPKQYLKINNETILNFTIKRFLNLKFVHKILVLINNKHFNCSKTINKHPLIKILKGGESRQLSSLNGLMYAKKNNFEYILIHDAVRPLVSQELIIRVFKSLMKNDAVIPVIKIQESIKFIKDKQVHKDINREHMYTSQTPQGFNTTKLLNAYKKIKKNDLDKYTDDAQIYSMLKKKINIVDGDELNKKITTKKDYDLIKKMLEKNNNTKIGHGIDFHKFCEGKNLVIFGKKINFSKGLEGHSDADVGIHALIDAICGALNLGDIGKLFPDKNPKYKNIDSKILLGNVNQLIIKNNAQLIHADNTIICEKPRISKYTLQMRKILSDILCINKNCISIKATTTEKMGFLGKGEGIAAISIVTMKQTI